MLHHISIATPTAPTTKYSISFTTLPVLTAAPGCKPGADVAVPVPSVAPAPPVGVESDSGTTVVEVITVGMPLMVVVCRTMLVDEDLLVFAEVLVELVEPGVVEEGGEAVAIVLAPPPAVVTITRP